MEEQYTYTRICIDNIRLGDVLEEKGTNPFESPITYTVTGVRKDNTGRVWLRMEQDRTVLYINEYEAHNHFFVRVKQV